MPNLEQGDISKWFKDKEGENRVGETGRKSRKEIDRERRKQA
jgi:hypothetical protein